MMNEKWFRNKNKRLLGYIIRNKSGNSLPMVMLVALVVMIISSAVAHTTMQMFSIAKGSFNDQIAYIAAETALERSIENLEQIITAENYPASRGIHYSDATTYIEQIINKMNATGVNEDTDIIKNYHDIKVHENMNGASVDVSFAWYGGTSSVSGNKITFPIEISATATLDNNVFKSYGKKSVAVREFSVWIYKPFELNGAIYTLGDVVARGSDTATVDGDIYTFGTGLVQPNRMEQYYNGGVCAYYNETLHVMGNIFTRSLVRAGCFSDSDGNQSNSANIVVDKNVVAQGIDVFGSNDNIVIIGDAYTFDDVEMHGANSYICINGNYYGLNYGDGFNHDTSSSILNVAPRYGASSRDSRIVVSGDMYINGVQYRIKGDGSVGHIMESASLTWKGNQPVYIADGVPEDHNFFYIDNHLKTTDPSIERNGFSILWKVNWSNDGSVIKNDWSRWSDWISEVRSRANGFTNSITTPAANTMTGYCANAIAANNTIYWMDLDSGLPNYVMQQTDPSKVASNLDGIDHSELQSKLLSAANIAEYMDKDIGVPAALRSLKNDIEAKVNVFARRIIEPHTIEYYLNEGESPDPLNIPYISEFMRLKVLLDDKFNHDPYGKCTVEFDASSSNSTVDINEYLVANFNALSSTGEDYRDYYFMVMNYNPDKVIKVSDKFNGIIFSLGKVELKGSDPSSMTAGAQINGSIIAAGQGYSSSSPYKNGSAADGNDSLPRVDVTSDGNKSVFDSFGYAAIIIESDASIRFNKTELFENFENQSGSRKIELEDILFK